MFISKRTIAFLAGLTLASAAYAAPHFADVTVSDSDDGDATESFATDTPQIVVTAHLVDVASGSKLTGTWIAEDTGGAAPPNYKIDSADVTAGSIMNTVTFRLSKPNAGWPVGTYRVDMYIDGKPAGAAHFKVAKDS